MQSVRETDRPLRATAKHLSARQDCARDMQDNIVEARLLQPHEAPVSATLEPAGIATESARMDGVEAMAPRLYFQGQGLPAPDPLASRDRGPCGESGGIFSPFLPVGEETQRMRAVWRASRNPARRVTRNRPKAAGQERDNASGKTPQWRGRGLDSSR